MSNTDKGVLIFNEWFEAMDKLNPKEFKKLMLSIYEYQAQSVEPPVFEGKTAIVADMIFPYIRRRIAMSEALKRARGSRGKQLDHNPIVDELLRTRADR